MSPDDTEGTGSWNEERRLIASNLRAMNRSIEILTTRIETMSETNRDRIGLVERQVNTQLNDNTMRIAMLEVKAKTWGAIAGFLASLVVAAIELVAKTIK